MTDVTLHFKAQITSRECAVCGTRLDRSDRDHWWLRNTWTAAVQDYHEGGGCLHTDWFRPCGRLPAEYGKPPNDRIQTAPIGVGWNEWFASSTEKRHNVGTTWKLLCNRRSPATDN